MTYERLDLMNPKVGDTFHSKGWDFDPDLSQFKITKIFSIGETNYYNIRCPKYNVDTCVTGDCVVRRG